MMSTYGRSHTGPERRRSKHAFKDGNSINTWDINVSNGQFPAPPPRVWQPFSCSWASLCDLVHSSQNMTPWWGYFECHSEKVRILLLHKKKEIRRLPPHPPVGLFNDGPRVLLTCFCVTKEQHTMSRTWCGALQSFNRGRKQSMCPKTQQKVSMASGTRGDIYTAAELGHFGTERRHVLVLVVEYRDSKQGDETSPAFKMWCQSTHWEIGCEGGQHT